jgi:FKBP-type peptidyl-prolyl cis-trans isomerase SlyD
MAIENGQKVSMTYELTVEGNPIDSNVGRDPLEFSFGMGQVIPGLEARIKDMSAGDVAEVDVPAAEAYGEYNEAAMEKVPQEQFGDMELEVGMPLQGQGDDGQVVQASVVAIEEDGVVLDFNHPLAGAELHFKVTINSIG